MSAKENIEDTQLRVGPLSLLKQSLNSHTHVLIHCRNDRKLLGTIKAFDRHMNLVMENVKEIWRESPRKGKGRGKGRPLCKERFHTKLFIRGDSIILVMKNPFVRTDK